MTTTTVVTALRLILSLAIAGPAQAWPGDPGASIAAPSSVDCAWGAERVQCDGLVSIHAASVALARKPVHPHIRKTEHASLPPTTHLPDREDDPLASMHFE